MLGASGRRPPFAILLADTALKRVEALRLQHDAAKKEASDTRLYGKGHYARVAVW